MNNVNETMRDFGFYRNMIFGAPLAVLGIAIAVGISLVVLTCVGNFCCCCFKCLCPVRFILDGLRDVMLRMTNFLLFEFEHKKQGDKHIYLLYGVRVSIHALNFLFILLVGIVFASLISFWNTFLTEASLGECDPRADCFPITRQSFSVINFSPSSRERISDCDNIVINDEASTIVCFRMSYRYSEGLGEAGGFLFSMQVIANIFIYVVVRTVRVVLKVMKILVYKTTSNPNNKEMSCKIKCVSFFAKLFAILVIQTMYVGILIILPLQLVVLRGDFRETLVTPQRALQLVLYSYTICLLFLVPLFVGIFVQGYEVYDHMDISLYLNRSNGKKSNPSSSAENPEARYNENEVQAY